MTVGQYLKTLFVMGYALIGGMVIFSVIAIVVLSNGVQFEGGRATLSDVHAPNMVFYIAVIVLVLGGVAGSFTLFKNRLVVARQKAGLSEKLQAYRAAVVTRYAFLEGPGLFSIIVYFVTGDIRVLVATAAIIALMLYAKPSREKLIADLELSSNEAAIMNDDNSIIG